MFFFAPSGHPARGPSFHLESLLRDAYRLDGHSEVHRVEEMEKGKVILNGSNYRELRMDDDVLDRDHHTGDFLIGAPISHLDTVAERAMGERTCPSWTPFPHMAEASQPGPNLPHRSFYRLNTKQPS